MAPIAVDAVLKVTERGREAEIDLKNIKDICSLGGTVEDTRLIDGLVFTMRLSGINAPKRIEKAKIGLKIWSTVSSSRIRLTWIVF